MIELSKDKNYNLEERTAEFGGNIIKFCRTLKQDSISNPIINQLVRSATSIGANYMEANGASLCFHSKFKIQN
jgi:four helix bundle protein